MCVCVCVCVCVCTVGPHTASGRHTLGASHHAVCQWHWHSMRHAATHARACAHTHTHGSQTACLQTNEHSTIQVVHTHTPPGSLRARWLGCLMGAHPPQCHHLHHQHHTTRPLHGAAEPAPQALAPAPGSGCHTGPGPRGVRDSERDGRPAASSATQRRGGCQTETLSAVPSTCATRTCRQRQQRCRRPATRGGCGWGTPWHQRTG